MAGRGIRMREIWITEAGVVTAAGNNLEATWEHLMAGRTAIRKIDRFPVQAYQSEIGAFIPDLKSFRGRLIAPRDHEPPLGSN